MIFQDHPACAAFSRRPLDAAAESLAFPERSGHPCQQKGRDKPGQTHPARPAEPGTTRRATGYLSARMTETLPHDFLTSGLRMGAKE